MQRLRVFNKKQNPHQKHVIRGKTAPFSAFKVVNLLPSIKTREFHCCPSNNWCPPFAILLPLVTSESK